MYTDEEEKKFYQQVGELIKSHRIRSDKSHENLANYLGLSRSSIINIENGRQNILLHSLVGVADFLSIPITELIPLKQTTNRSIDEDVKSKINKKITSESQVNKFEDFINLSSSKNSSNDSS